MKKYMIVILLLVANRLTAQLSFGFTYTSALEGVEVGIVFKNGPAEKAGLKSGDYILMVNDSVLRIMSEERIAKVFAAAPVTSRFQLGYINEDDGEIYRGQIITVTKQERNSFLNKCLEGDCINGTGKHIDMTGSVYEGGFKNGKRNGIGKCIATNGVVYEGDWKNNEREGTGKAWYKVKGYDFGNKNWSYEGTWKKDSIDGKGIYRYGDGSCYTGEVKNNSLEGKGRMVLKDSTMYEGDWKNNALNGKGSILFKNGDLHTGTFINNKLEGVVTIFTKASGTTVVREYKNGKAL